MKKTEWKIDMQVVKITGGVEMSLRNISDSEQVAVESKAAGTPRQLPVDQAKPHRVANLRRALANGH